MFRNQERRSLSQPETHDSELPISPCYHSAVISTVILASVMAAAVASLLRAVRVGDRTLEIISKTTASAVFVMLGLDRWSPGDAVGTWLIAALVLCAAGDLCLLWDRSFDLGLISFLLGHLAYVIGFGVALPWTAATGAILFYLSDLAVARHRFVHESFVNRAIGLPTYYLGQLLLALTIGAR